MSRNSLKPRILVVTVVHHPEDARIRHRQIEALLAAGWHVTYAAPFDGFAVPRRESEGLRCRNLPRSSGRRRFRALLAARKLIRKEYRRHDVVLIHDPELLIALFGLGVRNVVWDVHEDTFAALETKKWLPSIVRTPVQAAVRSLESWAEKRFALLLAEYEYQSRFKKTHKVVPNSVRPTESLIAPGKERVVYLGSVTEERGAAMLIQVGEALNKATNGECRLHVIGPGNDDFSKTSLSHASREGYIIWHGFLPQNEALPLLDGALAGVSFLQDVPNYRHSMPTKILEYMAHGLPVVTTPLPLPKNLISRSNAGSVVGFDNIDQALVHLVDLYTDHAQAEAAGRRGYEVVKQQYNWNINAGEFLSELERVVNEARNHCRT